jgi:hypothetical protein
MKQTLWTNYSFVMLKQVVHNHCALIGLVDIVFIVCLAEFGSLVLDVVYVLQHYKDMWESNQWVEKFEVQPCHEKHRYRFA